MIRTVVRRLRGVLGTAILWAVVWAIAAVPTGVYHRLRYGSLDSSSMTGTVLEMMTIQAFYGAVGGALFAAALTVVERRRTLESLHLGRVAAWGALGGMGLPLLFFALTPSLPGGWASILALFGGLGAACAAGTLALARRPDRTTA